MNTWYPLLRNNIQILGQDHLTKDTNENFSDLTEFIFKGEHIRLKYNTVGLIKQLTEKKKVMPCAPHQAKK